MSLLCLFVAIHLCFAISFLGLFIGSRMLGAVQLFLSQHKKVELMRLALGLSFVLPLLAALAKSSFGWEITLVEIMLPASNAHGSINAVNKWLQFEIPLYAFFLTVTLASTALIGDIIALKTMIWRTDTGAKFKRLAIRYVPVGNTPFAVITPVCTYIALPHMAHGPARRAILHHELSHIRHHDLAWNWVILAAGFVLYLNPAYWLWRMVHQELCEQACDARVLQQSPICATDYARALLAMMCSAPVKTAHLSRAFIGPLANRKRLPIARFENILNPAPHMSGHKFFASLCCTVCVIVGFATTFQVTHQSWSLLSLETSTHANLKRMKTSLPAPAFGLVFSS